MSRFFFCIVCLLFVILEISIAKPIAFGHLDPRFFSLFQTALTTPVVIYGLLQFFLVNLVLMLIPIGAALVIGFYYSKKINTDKYLLATASFVAIKIILIELSTVVIPKSIYSNYLIVNNPTLALAGFSLIVLFTTIPIFKRLTPFFLSINRNLITRRRITIIFASIGTLLSCQIYWNHEQIEVDDSAKNIILIGMDSVSYQHVKSNLHFLPNIKKLTNTGVEFTNAITPLARTFPTWHSVLSGKYPTENGVRYNLTNRNITKTPNIVTKLKDKGYATIFAQDERRFNNIDESWGFDRTVGPKVGILDFILPTMFDIPAANLLYNSQIGPILFPYISNNRASAHTYDPNFFVQSIVDNIPEGRPIFLASHFCIAHIPFKWKDSKSNATHIDALKILDNQIGLLLKRLHDKNLLENSIVILFSDHGESVAKETQEYFISFQKGLPDDLSRKLFSVTPGHGVNINNKNQYHSFLWVGDGKYFLEEYDKEIHRTVNKNVSLININDFIYDLIYEDQSVDDIADKFSHREIEPIYLETGIFFSSIKNPEIIDTQQLLEEASSHYELLPNGYISLKPESIPIFLKTKQKGIIYGKEMLFYYPLKEKPSFWVYHNEAKGQLLYWRQHQAAPLLAQPLIEKFNSHWQG